MIEVTDEMVDAVDEIWVGGGSASQAVTALLAIVERDRSDALGLTRAANAARRIADRYGEKGNDRSRADWRMWTAMSAGARAVTIRLTELADAEEAS